MNLEIGKILLIFKNEKDLSKNVLNFFAPSLIILNKISEKINSEQVSSEHKREFDKIIKSDLLKLLDSYTKLPIETRDSLIINPHEDKKQTALDTLIQSLNILSLKINSLWDNILENDKKNLIVRRMVLESTYDNNYEQELEFEKEDVDHSLDIQKELKALMKKAEGSWQNGFTVKSTTLTTPEENNEEGLTPFTAMLIFISITAIVVLSYILL